CPVFGGVFLSPLPGCSTARVAPELGGSARPRARTTKITPGPAQRDFGCMGFSFSCAPYRPVKRRQCLDDLGIVAPPSAAAICVPGALPRRHPRGINSRLAQVQAAERFSYLTPSRGTATVEEGSPWPFPSFGPFREVVMSVPRWLRQILNRFRIA